MFTITIWKPRILLQPSSTASLESSTVIFLSEHFDYETMQQLIRSLRQITRDITVLIVGSLHHEEKEEYTKDKLFFLPMTVGADGANIMVAIDRAMQMSPDSHNFFIFEDSHDQSFSKRDLEKIVKRHLDYLRSSNGGFFISKRYASHLLISSKAPSENDAIQSGFRADVSFREIIHSPRDAIRRYATILKFALVGATGVGVNLITLTLFKFLAAAFFAGTGALFANAVALELSLANNFVWNDKFTFRTSGLSPPYARLYRFVKYNLVSLFSFGVNELVFYLAYSRSGIWYVTSDLLAIAVAFVINYVGSSKWAWARELRLIKD